MRNFIKKTEDFTCDNCGEQITGTGYTNHCPNCLYSKHVDKDIPGDRGSSCKGLMEPLGIKKEGKKTQILYKCADCGKESFCKTTTSDNLELLTKLAQQPLASH